MPEKVVLRAREAVSALAKLLRGHLDGRVEALTAGRSEKSEETHPKSMPTLSLPSSGSLPLPPGCTCAALAPALGPDPAPAPAAAAFLARSASRARSRSRSRAMLRATAAAAGDDVGDAGPEKGVGPNEGVYEA